MESLVASWTLQNPIAGASARLSSLLEEAEALKEPGADFAFELGQGDRQQESSPSGLFAKLQASPRQQGLLAP